MEERKPGWNKANEVKAACTQLRKLLAYLWSLKRGRDLEWHVWVGMCKSNYFRVVVATLRWSLRGPLRLWKLFLTRNIICFSFAPVSSWRSDSQLARRKWPSFTSLFFHEASLCLRHDGVSLYSIKILFSFLLYDYFYHRDLMSSLLRGEEKRRIQISMILCHNYIEI